MSMRRVASRLLMLGSAFALLSVPALPINVHPLRTATLLPAGFVLADDSSLAAKQKEIAKALATAQATYEAAGTKVQAAARAYTTANEELPGARNALAKANGAVIAAQVTLDQANAAVDKAQARVTTADRQLAAAERTVAGTSQTIGSIAATAYMGSGLTSINVLMNPGSPTEVLDRLTLLDQVESTQRQALARYVSARRAAKDAYKRSVAAQNVAQQTRKAAMNALLDTQSAQGDAQAAAKTVADLVASTKTALAVAQQNKAATLAAYKQLQQENAQVTAQLAAQAARDRAAGRPPTRAGPVTGTSGYFSMPLQGWVSSPFGWRFDPFYKRWQLHAGVDIAAAGGTPIKAAGSGTIIRAGWDGGYGNYTCIDNGVYEGPGQYHGKGVATCYAHQSKILVHAGQQVREGQVIGLVGETGAAIGYHLHFEVRVDGVPVQPLNWLPKCFC